MCVGNSPTDVANYNDRPKETRIDMAPSNKNRYRTIAALDLPLADRWETTLEGDLNKLEGGDGMRRSILTVIFRPNQRLPSSTIGPEGFATPAAGSRVTANFSKFRPSASCGT